MLLTWISIVAAAGAAALGVRWFLNRVDALGRRVRFPWISVGLLVVLAVGAAVPGILRGQQEARLARVASQLSGVKVAVHCQSLSGTFVDAGAELGYVKYGSDGVPERSTLIKHDQCSALNAYLKSSKRAPSQAQVVAVHVLTHESMHMKGITSESRAECAAMQRDARTARLLGADPQQARALAVRYWRTVYPYMPDDYRDSGCAKGGALDEGLGDGPWN